MTYQSLIPVVAERILHLDLKGTPPSFPRLMQLLELFARLRFTGILVEWEDSFPWSVDPTFRSVTVYSEDEVREFVKRADELGLELIPLVQTLGHMENFLKGEDRVALRTVPTDLEVLNPLAEGAAEFVTSIILDILRLMPNVKRLHLGGDEARTLGAHPQTKAYIEEHSAGALYLAHVEPLFQLLAERGIRPLLWADMMVEWDDSSIIRLAKQSDLVVWGYSGHPDHSTIHDHPKHTQRYAELGVTVWGATAFKGADHYAGDRPSLANRRVNGAAWVEVVQRYGLAGLITTGWSRYFFSLLQCETIEASLDSLLQHSILMYNGVCDEAQIASPEALLAALWNPEDAKQFIAVRGAANTFAEAHRVIWKRLLSIEAEVSAKHSPVHHLEQLQAELIPYREAAVPYRTVLEPLIPRHWVDQYFADREKGIQEFLGKIGLSIPN